MSRTDIWSSRAMCCMMWCSTQITGATDKSQLASGLITQHSGQREGRMILHTLKVYWRLHFWESIMPNSSTTQSADQHMKASRHRFLGVELDEMQSWSCARLFLSLLSQFSQGVLAASEHLRSQEVIYQCQCHSAIACIFFFLINKASCIITG